MCTPEAGAGSGSPESSGGSASEVPVSRIAAMSERNGGAVGGTGRQKGAKPPTRREKAEPAGGAVRNEKNKGVSEDWEDAIGDDSRCVELVNYVPEFMRRPGEGEGTRHGNVTMIASLATTRRAGWRKVGGPSAHHADAELRRRLDKLMASSKSSKALPSWKGHGDDPDALGDLDGDWGTGEGGNLMPVSPSAGGGPVEADGTDEMQSDKRGRALSPRYAARAEAFEKAFHGGPRRWPPRAPGKQSGKSGSDESEGRSAAPATRKMDPRSAARAGLDFYDSWVADRPQVLVFGWRSETAVAPACRPDADSTDSRCPPQPACLAQSAPLEGQGAGIDDRRVSAASSESTRGEFVWQGEERASASGGGTSWKAIEHGGGSSGEGEVWRSADEESDEEVNCCPWINLRYEDMMWSRVQ
eukprot:evm.model.scf_893.5 EVM.evm.TU.scf_893.5   scf_893:47059-48303(-)